MIHLSILTSFAIDLHSNLVSIDLNEHREFIRVEGAISESNGFSKV